MWVVRIAEGMAAIGAALFVLMNVVRLVQRYVQWRKLLPLAALVCLPGAAEATTIVADSCSNAHIQAAVDASTDGDTVSVPSGSCTWVSSVTVPNTKGIILQGAGSGSTLITMGGSKLVLQTSSARQALRVTGFSFIKNSGTSWDLQITGTAQNWRIDHNIFDGGSINGGYQIRVGDANANTESFAYGVIDHNTFTNLNFHTSIFIEWSRGVLDPDVGGDWIWSQTAQRGTAQAVYIEDNIFDDDGGVSATQKVDCRWGCKYVFRYNTVHNPWISTHSGCTNGGRDPMWQEIYNNTFTDDANRYGGSQIEMRSTSGVFFGNTFAATANKYSITVDHERSFRTDCAGTYGGQADGTRAWDENSDVAWRALGQPGWGPPQATNMSAYSFAGVFAWGNLNNGSLVNLGVANNTGNTPTHVVANREYFNSAAISTGTLASRPSTCSAGPSNRDVYRATDQNSFGVSLYICSATNTWTLQYEPYTYPHPLQGASGGEPSVGSVILFIEWVGTAVGIGWHFRRAVMASCVLAWGLAGMMGAQSKVVGSQGVLYTKLVLAKTITAAMEKLK